MNRGMEKRIQKFICSIVVCMMAVLVLPGLKSEAAAKTPGCVKKQTVYLTKSDLHAEGAKAEPYYLDYTDLSSFIFVKNLSKDAKITNMKSSNKNITVWSGLDAEGAEKGKYIGLNGKKCKPGQKSTITFRVKQNGKTYKLSCKITLKQKPSNFKTFSIGGKNYASRLKGYSGTGKVASFKIRPLKGTFKIKMIPGVKLEQVRIVRSGKDDNLIIKKIKNGSKVSFQKGDTIQISYKYTKKPANYNFTYREPAAMPVVAALQRSGVTVINVK